jgi:predicted unusual protein kinase regulating ubiquinone biosynthesis (AarF/ABC1/UbiB family)
MAKEVEGGRLQRMARLAGLAARTGRDLATARAKQILTQGDPQDLGETLRPTAERMVEVLGGLKGAATKMGQFISLVDQEVFPPEARQALQKLLNQAPQRLSPEQAREVLAAELGGTPEELFAQFDPEPFAAASMGQVHGATLFDGRDVVVKIQFPGVDKAIEADLRNAGAMTAALSLAGGVFDARRYYDELAMTLRRELDYREEAKQLDAFRVVAQRWPEMVLPEHVPERSSSRVLTMTRLRGPTMLEFANDETQSQEERFRVAALLVYASWGPFLATGLIHADPHPGNYIVCADGRLGVLDFGATRQLEPIFVETYWQILTAMMTHTHLPLREVLTRAGFELRADPAQTDQWLEVLSEIVERPVRRDFYDFGACEMAVDIRKVSQKFPAVTLQSRPPEKSLMFYRALMGLAGDLRLLRAAGDFRTVVSEVMRRAEGS